MKRKILLFAVMSSFITLTHAQQDHGTSGYAITSSEKGGRNWKEVRLVNVQTGEPLKNIFNSHAGIVALNARTGKPVRKETTQVTTGAENSILKKPERKVVNLDEELNNGQVGSRVQVKRIVVHRTMEDRSKPFATNSAAMAYDSKHERLYFTPMGINQLRYIDLRKGKIYFFEDEPFGTVTGYGDVKNQVTRMVIASDGNGYALTNDALHLLRFTTGRKPSITDLGPVTQGNVAAGGAAIGRHYGGDMIADASGNLYLIAASRNVFKINIATKLAEHLGVIKGLPQGFSTNGAMVEGGSKVIVCSSESTLGYFRFDLNTLEAEKISKSGDVYNASDLANGVLAFDKKRDEPKEEETVTMAERSIPNTASEKLAGSGISVYPNPVTDGRVRVSFNDLPAGTYQMQLADMSGKLVLSRAVNINSKGQVQELQLPKLASGSYVLNVLNAGGASAGTRTLVIQ